MKAGVLRARFNLRPDSKRPHFFRVFIFRDRYCMVRFFDEQRSRSAAMRAAARGRRGGRWQAQTNGWKVMRYRSGKWTTSNCVGQILFHDRFMGAGVVSHEMTHAALFYVEQQLKRRPFDLERDNERVAHVQGELTRKFWVAYFRRARRKRAT